MNPKGSRPRLRAAALLGYGLLAGVLPASAQLASQAYETPLEERAVDVLPTHLLQSGHHRVRDRVSLEGEIYAFEIESDYGLYQVQSIAMLEIRVHEILTLAQAIGQFELQDDAFAQHLRGQLTVDAHSLVDVVTAPLSMAGQLAANLEQTAEELSDLSRGWSPPPEQGRYADQTPSDPITGAHKRNVAYQLSLDGYSTNPKVQEFLNAVARARSRGHFKAGVATITVPRARTVRVAGGRLQAEVGNLLKNLTPAELDEGIDEQLRHIGVSKRVRDSFVRHPSFSPKHKTAITAHLDFLRGVRNRPAVIEAAVSASSEPGALSHELLVRMLAHYHESVDPIAELLTVSDLPLAMTVDERLLIALPVDRIHWTRQTDEVFGTLWRRFSMSGGTGAELVLTGTLSEAARQGLTRHGFAIKERFLDAE